MNERTKIEAVELFIIRSLINGKNVVIPEFGHLEIKYLSDRRTVLFKSTANRDSFLRTMSTVEEKQRRAIKALYIIISIPLKEEKIVTLPKIGVFRPVKLDTGEIHVSFVLSTYLRKLLYEKEKETKNGSNVSFEKEKKEPVRITYTDESRKRKEMPKKEVKIIKTSEIYALEIDAKSEMPEAINLKRNDIMLENTISFSDGPKNTKTTKIINPPPIHDDDVVEKSKVNKLHKIFLSVAIGVALIMIIVSTIYSGNNKKSYHRQEINIESNAIDLPSLAQKYYGHPAFWIYIYEANMDKLSSPINIPETGSLVIPDLKTEYDVDTSDSMEIQRANILADILLKEAVRKK